MVPRGRFLNDFMTSSCFLLLQHRPKLFKTLPRKEAISKTGRELQSVSDCNLFDLLVTSNRKRRTNSSCREHGRPLTVSACVKNTPKTTKVTTRTHCVPLRHPQTVLHTLLCQESLPSVGPSAHIWSRLCLQPDCSPALPRGTPREPSSPLTLPENIRDMRHYIYCLQSHRWQIREDIFCSPQIKAAPSAPGKQLEVHNVVFNLTLTALSF